MKNFRLIAALILLIVQQGYTQDKQLGIVAYTSRAAYRNAMQGYFQWGDKTDVTADVKSILDEHIPELLLLAEKFNDKSGECARPGGGRLVRQMPWLPGYFIKHDIQRYFNAKDLAKYIKQENLTEMAVADKRLYHLFSKSFRMSDANYFVIAKKADGIHNDDPQALTVSQEFQLKKIKEKCKDVHPSNWVISEWKYPAGKKVTIIDTDSFAMPSEKKTNMGDTSNSITTSEFFC